MQASQPGTQTALTEKANQLRGRCPAECTSAAAPCHLIRDTRAEVIMRIEYGDDSLEEFTDPFEFGYPSSSGCIQRLHGQIVVENELSDATG